MSSASALDAASFRTLGAPSTTAFASFSPRPVTSRTTLITLTLLAPTSVSSTSNSSFSSAAASPAPAAATTTPAAADTPNSSSHAFTKSFLCGLCDDSYSYASSCFSAIWLITRAKFAIGDWMLPSSLPSSSSLEGMLDSAVIPASS